jgi:hypothetical protein
VFAYRRNFRTGSLRQLSCSKKQRKGGALGQDHIFSHPNLLFQQDMPTPKIVGVKSRLREFGRVRIPHVGDSFWIFTHTIAVKVTDIISNSVCNRCI